MLSEHIFGVVLAGGSGTRFWPKSRQQRPKQLCKIGSDHATMLELTLQRFNATIPAERRLIVTHVNQLPQTKNLVSKLCQRFVGEPEARNTAAALVLAALEVEAAAKPGTKPIMISVHADALIQKPDIFVERLKQAVQLAEQGFLTLVGIKPTHPETGYGYIEVGAQTGVGHRVASFREKPDAAMADSYVRSEKFLWNSGIFVWQTETFLREVAALLPDTLTKLRALVPSKYQSFSAVPAAEFAAVYRQLQNIAVDNAILEKSNNVAVVGADIGWQDVGSWDALSSCYPADNNGNIIIGDAVCLDAKGVTIDTDAPFVAALGVENLIIVANGNAILVCPKDRAQDVKKVVEWAKTQGRNDLI